MRKSSVVLILALVGLAALPDAGQAFGRRRRCPPAPCYYVPVVLPCYGPGQPVVTWGPGYGPAPAMQGRPVTIKGRMYQVFRLGDAGVNDKEDLDKPQPGVAFQTTDIPVADVFNGKARRIAKVNIFAGE